MISTFQHYGEEMVGWTYDNSFANISNMMLKLDLIQDRPFERIDRALCLLCLSRIPDSVLCGTCRGGRLRDYEARMPTYLSQIGGG